MRLIVCTSLYTKTDHALWRRRVNEGHHDREIPLRSLCRDEVEHAVVAVTKCRVGKRVKRRPLLEDGRQNLYDTGSRLQVFIVAQA